MKSCTAGVWLAHPDWDQWGRAGWREGLQADGWLAPPLISVWGGNQGWGQPEGGAKGSWTLGPTTWLNSPLNSHSNSRLSEQFAY